MHGMVARITFFTILLLLGSACSSTYRAYSGPKQPSSEIASISSEGKQPGRFAVDYYYLYFAGVDDQFIGFDQSWQQLDLQPGHRCVKLVLQKDVLYLFSEVAEVPYPLCLNMEAGHIYQAQSGYDVNNDRHFYWIVDTSNGRIVAGEGPPDEPIQEPAISED